MFALPLAPQRLLRFSQQLLLAGLVMLLLGLVAAYGLEAHLSISALVLAHSLTLVGPALLKIGYVLRLAAQAGMSERRPVHASA